MYENMKQIEQTILAIWNVHLAEYDGYFIRFKDKNKMNCSVANLAWVSPVQAFRHSDWCFDWDMSLTDDEVTYVKSNWTMFYNYFKEQEQLWKSTKDFVQHQ